MEISQLEQMIRWLDDERKRDRAQLAALEERVLQQQSIIESQATEIQGLEQDVTRITADLRRTDDYAGMIEKTNRDMTSNFDTLKTQMRRDKLDGEQVRRTEIEVLNEMITEMDKKIRPLLRYDEQLSARAAGEQRLQGQVQTVVNALADLTKRTEDRLQAIVYLEEQRRADTRRLAALEGDLPPLRKAIDEQATRQMRLEDNLRKLPTRVDEAIAIAKSYDPRIEELRIADFQREQKVKQYLDQAELVNVEVQRLVEQTQKYALLFNQNKQALDGLEAFQTRLERRMNEIAEMQRLTEERLRREWEEWQATFARDWQKRQVTEEDRWRRQDLNNQQGVEHDAAVDEQLELMFAELLALWQELSVIADRWTVAISDMMKENRTVPSEHVKSLRTFAEEHYRQLL